MKIYKPAELHAFLNSLGIHAKKGLSQNFLIDGNIIGKIIACSGVQKGDLVLEIGPGPGALTQALLEKGAHVTAVEMDRVFAEALNRLQIPGHHLTVVEQDFLKFPLLEFLQEHASQYKKVKVVANLPYHITTPILSSLLPLHRWIESVTTMVQKEFGERMSAKVGSPEYSSFTLFLEFYSKVHYAFTVSPNCFYPRPKVHSAVVKCILHPPPLEENDIEAFFAMTRGSFQKRRKMLRSSLKELYPVENIEAALLSIGVNPMSRPEELSLNQFLALFRFLGQ
jgi:16S rRNA (adenine1518-N6/adenine1519-N6)-dimethyltransferase